MHQQYPRALLYWILGQDHISLLDTWHDLEGILALCTLVVGQRPGADKGDTDDNPWVHRLQYIRTPQLDLSSTEIRQRRNTGQGIRYMVPEQVASYITTHGLYAD